MRCPNGNNCENCKSFFTIYYILYFETFLQPFSPSDYPGCVSPGGLSYIEVRGFPNPSYNGDFFLSKKDKDLVLYNYHAVFEKDNQCIWFANDHYWHMGNCNNLGENSVYILKKRKKECPNNFEKTWNGKNFDEKFTGSWYSGEESLSKSVKTILKFDSSAIPRNLTSYTRNTS